MEGFHMLRLVLSIAFLGVVSFVAVKHYRHGDWHHHGEHHHELRKKMYEAHECHEKCGEDVSCHSKCPKPLAALAKACGHFPVVRKCMDSCKGTDCDKCATFEEDWINKKFLKHPEKAMRKAERKCSAVVSAHSCHIGCKRGDFKCHSQCPSIFHHHWHHREGHRGYHDDEEHHHHCEIREKMREAHACHKKCGEDVSCHSKCPKPLASLAKACDHLPVVKKCMGAFLRCGKDADCAKCATFEEDWINRKFMKNPEKALRLAEMKCPVLVSARSCHVGCKRGDFKCHSQCPSEFFDHGRFDRHAPQFQYQRYRPRFMEKDLEKPGIIV